MSEQNANLRGALFALLAFGIFASHDVVIKYLGGSYSPFQIVFFSVLFGFPIVTFLLMRDARPGNLRPVHPWWTAARTVAAVITGVCAFYAFSTLPLTQVYAILFAAPLLITLLAIPMLGESVGWRRGLAVIVGLGGVLVVLQPTTATLELGHVAALAAAFGSAFASIIVRKIGRDERSVVLILYPMMANFVLMGAALPFVYQPMPLVDIGASAVISAMALTATACLIIAYKTGQAVIVAPMQYSQIIWASLFGFLFFDEGIDQPTLIGTAIIVASGIYIVLREGRGDTSRTTPVLRTRSRAGTPTAPRVANFLPKGQRGPQAPDHPTEER
ncbi:EamA family transporter [Roseobacter sp. HKCCD9010]|uniref:DMT family transporter n=1 Tax=unclassified Roseobacter TaxID=196798 RepID=UPI0014919574|nr:MULTISPECIES: DMT family transporter [unclassified Roseobacter]MBF9050961.1 EamA family transporter [Rhodobacterales bacterium HKCCD4356]NNV12730.1 EamA family transporter [Roseobacter sp. HKCCD7357]NNV16674.1 EamA family transporter [Roseobacter sp. HKCCD8768]NNV26694.1 EamA family transporter [Roseobacter sp. HKCCD8192]NNV30393.1 EamA family transporter [Roseobacter sp. HKCCD9061]